MDEKTFRFYGLDLKRVILGILLLSIVTLVGFFIPILLFDSKTPYLPALSAVSIGLLLTVILRSQLKVLWTVKIVDGLCEIYLGEKLKRRLQLPDLRKIHIRGWKHKKSYFLLRLTDGKGKLRIFVDGSDVAKITSIEGMKVFEELIFFLEDYALRNGYFKKDLKKSFTHADFRNLYYLRK